MEQVRRAINNFISRKKKKKKERERKNSTLTYTVKNILSTIWTISVRGSGNFDRQARFQARRKYRAKELNSLE